MALSPVRFAREGLGFRSDTWQEKVLMSKSPRLILNCSRQTGKSTVVAIKALHTAMYHENALVILLSPSLRQSCELSRKVSEFMNRLPIKLAPTEDNESSLRLTNGSRIVTLPSKEATVRGYSGATLIIEDEASRVEDRLNKAVRPMLAVSGGRLILMSTPFGRQGHFYEAWANGGSIWERIEVKATDCPRISKGFLEEEKKSQGEWWFRQEYLCEFVDMNDQVFSYDLVMSALSDQVEPLF
jgi:hypothetical protein